ncbi:hypothetical protein BDV34DRAFT_237511 [Aspergillus parasiticus]|uniref:Zn(2)-C6 fungal-type domain-containing protein n=1 Tax=Aspergillus parasiticus TaxID=5067 RepID=A0A5N6D8V8_ASPPA|nr:hypothetical protein BDV34DRAFT_237511 [Aspergillus parasiticus]
MTASRRKSKSRHGCFQCKRRSVKCDEKRPQCSNCENRRDICRCATPGPLLWANNTTSNRHGTSSPTNQLNIPHLKLLLNWTTSTCHTISRNHADARVWQALIPEKAVSCPNPLDGIFAVSALHLAMTRETNVGFALSSLLIVFAFGFPLATASQHQPKVNSLDELVQIFKLSRRMIKFATPTMNEEVQSSLSSSSRVVINALREQLNTVCSPTHEHYQAFPDTVACLEKFYVELDGTGDIVSRASMWICDVPETKCWWIASWRERVMNVTVATLCPEWKPSVAWALDTVNERH